MSEWQPHITVAAVIERQGKFLVVEEESDGRIVFNQPAGHLEEGESLLEGVARETLEETARHFVPEALIGIYSWSNNENGDTYMRFAFSGQISERDVERPLDTGIIDTHWMSRAELQEQAEKLRSPLVMRAIDDYLTGRRYPLGLLHELYQEVHDE